MSVIWGIPYLLIKVADSGVAVPVLVFARVAGGAVLLLPLAIRRRELAALRPRWRWLLLFAVVEMIVPWALLSEAEPAVKLDDRPAHRLGARSSVAVLARLTGGAERLSSSAGRACWPAWRGGPAGGPRRARRRRSRGRPR